MALGIFPEMDDFKIAKTLVEGRLVAKGIGTVRTGHQVNRSVSNDVRDAYSIV